VSFLLDTNVVSELRKRSPNPNVLAWHQAHTQAEVFLSVLVLGELRQGVERLRPRDSTQAEVLDMWISGLVRAYSDRILPISVEVADAWGRLNASVGSPAVDGLLAATALVHRLTLVTRNVADVARAGVAVVNPFQAP
jgi:toxin FitB